MIFVLYTEKLFKWLDNFKYKSMLAPFKMAPEHARTCFVLTKLLFYLSIIYNSVSVPHHLPHCLPETFSLLCQFVMPVFCHIEIVHLFLTNS